MTTSVLVYNGLYPQNNLMFISNLTIKSIVIILIYRIRKIKRTMDETQKELSTLSKDVSQKTQVNRSTITS